ncbi:MAG: TrmH family RNA methyltransferase, partial [Cyanobacteriota bacterium]
SAGRSRQGLLLLEGTHLVQEVLRLRLQPELLLATPAWCEGHRDLLASLPAGTQRRQATAAVLEAAASTRHPDGVLLTLAPPLPATPHACNEAPALVLALDRLQDPGNLGTLLRTALAAGVQQVWLGEGADPHSPKVLRASAGAALELPLLRLSSEALVSRVERARQDGWQIVATAATAPKPYWQLDWCQSTLLLLGNEGAGLAAPLLALADQRVSIPHSAAVESLNVAVAAAPLLLERLRQTLCAESRAPGGTMPASFATSR